MYKLLTFSAFILLTYSISAQNMLNGSVIDNTTGEPIIGANLTIKDTGQGTTTDFDGKYSFSSSKSFPWTIIVSYIGYETKSIIADGKTELNIRLSSDAELLDEVVVSASRKAEKKQESPSAISVLSGKKLALDNVSNPFLALRNTTGVDVSQMGVADGHINLRGRSAAFNTETFIIADYRNINLPSLGTMINGQNPIDGIDMEKIEVIKGPGGALYGPGVEAGVVHFISKSAFKEQGLTVSLGAGTQSQLQGALRYAGVSKSQKFGYKLTGYYRQARDFEIDLTDSIQKARVNAYPKQITSSLTGQKIGDPTINYDNEAYNVNATGEYRIGAGHSIIGVVGTGSSKSLFRSGQGDGFLNVSRPYAQLRYQNKGFFAQGFWSNQKGTDGTTWLYVNGLTQINDINQYEGQVQYNFNTLNDKLEVTTGADYRLNTIDTKGSVNGRNEDNDDYSIIGAYAQIKAKLASKLDLVAAGRYDQFKALDASGFSPRVALVYKASDNHTFRATWNHSLGAPSSLQLVNDFAAGDRGAFKVWLNAGSNPLTFNNNRYFSFVTNQAMTSPDLALRAAFAAATAGLKAANAALPYALLESAAFVGSITGTTKGTLMDAAGKPYAPLSRGVIGLSTSDMYEIGYVGKMGKLNMTVDLYYNSRKNNLTPGLTASPFIGYATAGADLAAAVETSLLANNIPAANAKAIAGAYTQAVNSLTQKNGVLSPLGLLSSDQSITGKTLDLTYFNVEEINYTGADLGLNYAIDKNWGVFTNYSYLSQVYWDAVKVTGSNTTVPFALNMPANRFRVGFDFIQNKGLVFNASVRYQDGFKSVNGLAWSGDIPAYTLVDAGLGYIVNDKLTLNISGTNLLNEKYRILANAPIIGTMVLAKAVYKIF